MAERARTREEDERRERRMTIEEAEACAAELGLHLVRDPRTKLGFCGVRQAPRGKFLPYYAVGQHQKQKVTIGHFSTIPEAALAYARWLGPEQSFVLAQRKQEMARKKHVHECDE